MDKEINVLDIETFEENSNVIPFCLCANINNKELIYYGIKKNVIKSFIFDILNNENTNITEIYAHNLNFDGMLIIEYLASSKLNFTIKSLKTNIYWIKIKYIEKVIIIRCSYKILPISLKKIGEIENFEKTLFPYKFIKRWNLEHICKIPDQSFWNDDDYLLFLKLNKKEYDVKKECISYCLNDIILLKKCLKNLFKVIDYIKTGLLENAFSSPSLSHNIFFSLFNYNKINKKINIKDSHHIRSAYFGGRCEVFGNISDHEHIKYYDFKGMYAQSMKEKFHIGNGYYTTKSDITKTGFHTITFNSKNMDLPILPIHSSTGKLLFVNGINTGTYWFEEINYFIEQGGELIKLHYSYIFDKFDFVFNKYIAYFEEIREKGGYYNIFGKLMINSLYGGMGLKNEKTINYITYSLNEFENICKNLNVSKFYKLNDVYIMIINIDYKYKKNMKNKINLEISNRNVSYAAAITSKARIKLHKFFNNVKNDQGRLLYCDTDSIFAGYNKNNINQNISTEKWLNFYNDGIFAAPKTYCVKNNHEFILKIKGISVKNITLEELKIKFYNNLNITFDSQKINAKKDFILKQKNIEKNINLSVYDKRIFSKDKKNTEPITHSYNE